MITQESMRKMAAEAKAEYELLLKLHPAGTYHVGRNNARDLFEKASFVAGHMESNGIESAHCIGPFGDLDLARGSSVFIAKGALIHTTRPGAVRGGQRSNRKQRITVHSVCKGWCNPDTGEIRNGTVEWAGAGGYWRWTDINNVVTVE